MKRWIHASTSSLDSKKYRGIWYGASKNPISVRDLLDKIIASNGRGFSAEARSSYTSDKLLEGEPTKEIYLIDEEKRGRLKLSDEAIDYLISNLSDDNWLKNKIQSLI